MHCQGKIAMSDFEAAYLSPVFTGVRFHFFGGSRDGTYREIGMTGTYTFGRDPKSSFAFSDFYPVDAMVSCNHASIRVTREGVYLRRLSPANGLELFGVPAAENGETPLSDGDLIRLGRGGPRICIRIGHLSELGQVDGSGTPLPG
jgi:predicted component of type VI protein secretion system